MALPVWYLHCFQGTGTKDRVSSMLAYAGGALELPQLLLAAAKYIPSPFCTWTQPSCSPDSAELQKSGAMTQVVEGLPGPLH